MANFCHAAFEKRESVWVHRIVHRAMAASKASGADLATQSEKAVEAVHVVHPHLSMPEVLAAVYSEGSS